MTYNDWPEDFPPITSLVPYSTLRHNDDPEIRELYDMAKNHEDKEAAVKLINKLFTNEGAESIREKIEALSSRNPNAIIAYIHAIEGHGKNQIPSALTKFIGEISGFEIDDSIVQADIVSKTGVKNTWYRMIHRPGFDGEVQSGREYILVDDVFSAGGTFSELRAFIESNGGKVVNAVTMANGSKSMNPQLGITKGRILELERKYGIESIRQFLKEESLYEGNHKALTDSEARTILGAATLDEARDRIASARQEGSGRIRGEVVQGTSLPAQVEKTYLKSPPLDNSLENISLSSLNKSLKEQIFPNDKNPVSYEADNTILKRGQSMPGEEIELDKAMILRANDSSNAFDIGTSIAKNYEENIKEIKSMESIRDKEEAIKKLHELTSEELKSRGQAVNAFVYGRARVNTNDGKNFDKAAEAHANVNAYMKSLRETESKIKVQSRKDDLASRIMKADADGLKEITVDGKVFYKQRKNWTTKPPKGLNPEKRLSASLEAQKNNKEQAMSDTQQTTESFMSKLWMVRYQIDFEKKEHSSDMNSLPFFTDDGRPEAKYERFGDSILRYTEYFERTEERIAYQKMQRFSSISYTEALTVPFMRQTNTAALEAGKNNKEQSMSDEVKKKKGKFFIPKEKCRRMRLRSGTRFTRGK